MEATQTVGTAAIEGVAGALAAEAAASDRTERAHGPRTVAIQGEQGSFSHEAVRAMLGPDVRVSSQPSFEALFAAVEHGAAEAALVPMENTLVGSIHENYERLRKGGLFAIGETLLRVEQCLIARPGAPFASIRRVASHPIALAQCAQFLKRHPGLEPVTVYDTAGAVRDLMTGGLMTQAAIGSRLAAELYGARVLSAGVQDDPWNVTRFLLVAREPLGPGAGDASWKTSLALRLPHGAGTLHRALSCFALRGLDLTKIESRAVAGPPWDYVFYLDAVGDPRGAVGDAVGELRGFARELRPLGSYPQALLRE